MDVLKRSWFWLVSGLLVLGSGAYWGVWVWGERGENGLLQGELETQHAQLKAWVDDPKSIPPKGQAEAYAGHVATLVSELAQSQALLKAPSRWRQSWPERPLDSYTPSGFKSVYVDKTTWLLQDDPAVPEKKANLGFLAKDLSFDLAKYVAPPSPEQIVPHAKRLMIQLDLVGVLNACKALRLPSQGIVFREDEAAVGVKRPVKPDLRRTAYAFTLTVDLRIQDLPALLDGLIASSFNYALTGMKVEKLKEMDRESLANAGFLPSEHRDDVVRAVLSCEAWDYLFAEKQP